MVIVFRAFPISFGTLGALTHKIPRNLDKPKFPDFELCFSAYTCPVEVLACVVFYATSGYQCVENISFMFYLY